MNWFSSLSSQFSWKKTDHKQINICMASAMKKIKHGKSKEKDGGNAILYKVIHGTLTR